jgi:hypothetical protein
MTKEGDLLYHDPLYKKICNTMMATIRAFPYPPSRGPALQRPDDHECIMDRRIFFDEPQMQTLTSSFDEKSQLFLKGSADRERARLPLFPGPLGVWIPENARLNS